LIWKKTQNAQHVTIYRFGNSKVLQQTLVFEEDILSIMNNFKQNTPTSQEAGGQLFGVLDKENIYLKYISTPKKTDVRSRFEYVPDRNKEKQEIAEMFKKGLNYIGDWHTHADSQPMPSSTDLKSIKDCFKKSKHQLNFFIMIIVGNGNLPESLSITIHNSNGFNKLELLNE